MNNANLIRMANRIGDFFDALPDREEALEGVAKGFAGQGDGLSIGLLKAARDLRHDEAMGDVPGNPDNR